jgi:hypothetical protein
VKLSLLHSKLSVSSSSYHLRLWSLISGVIGLASVKWRELPLLHPVNGLHCMCGGVGQQVLLKKNDIDA